MTTIQSVALISGSVIIFFIIVLGILIKGKQKPESSADIQLNIEPLPASTFEDELALAESQETVAYVASESADASATSLLVDKAGLIALYKKGAKEHKKLLRNTNQNILLFFILQGALMLFLLFLTLHSGDDASALMFVIGAMIYGIFLGYYIQERSKSVVDVISSPKYIRLKEKQFPEIWSTCRKLMGKMDLEEYTLNLWYVKTDAFEASVITEDKDVNLLLSRALISYYETNPKDVESILGHEFGHVYQGDTKMLLVNRKTIQIPAIIGTISVVLLIIVIVIALMRGDGLPETSGNITMVVCYWILVNARRNAELLADLASLAFVDDCTIEQLIEKYMSQAGTFNYPSSLQRLKSLELAKKQCPCLPTETL